MGLSQKEHGEVRRQGTILDRVVVVKSYYAPITVELSTHEAIEWEKNLAGVKALLGYYTGK